MIVASDLRLPRIVVEAPPATVRDDLPRMDVALLVGFAASGPVNVPVAIEQAAEFEAIFGPDVKLAWDAARGEPMRGELGLAVRSFFRNGGRRCWVVRVAGAVQPNRFPLSRLACWTKPPLLPWSAAPAVGRARSGGSWSDTLEAATEIERDPLAIRGTGNPAIDVNTLAVDIDALTGIEIGDVLRIAFGGDRFAVGSVSRVVPAAADALRVSLDAVQWLERVRTLPGCASVSFALADGTVVTRSAAPAPPDPQTDRRTHAGIDIAAQPDDRFRAGMIAEVRGTGTVWLMSVESTSIEDGASPPPLLRVRGPAWQWHQIPPPAPPPPPGAAIGAERLRLTLIVAQANREPVRLPGLGLSSAHPRYWGRLPDDDELFGPLADAPLEALPATARRTVLPRFPLAGGAIDPAAAELCVPLGDSPFPAFLPAYRASQPPAARDGLATFDPGLFLDSRLADAGAATLAARAEFVRYQSAPHPLRLNGIHAGFFIDEVSIVAIPDAIQSSWQMVDATEPGLASPPQAPGAPKVPCAPEGPFRECHPCTMSAPVVTETVSGDRIHLEWPPDPGDPLRETTYTVEEATLIGSTYAPWTPVAAGHRTGVDVYGRPPGAYAYRVIAARGGLVSVPSVPVIVLLAARPRPLVDSFAAAHSGLVTLHSALMRMCAARGDCLAVLALPPGFREDEAIDHARKLASNHADESALSYAAIYHPWLFVSDDQNVAARPTPPDGTACGILARRALERGAWIAPAAEPLNGVVALAPPLASERLLDLQRARVNVIRQLPRGFMVLDESTLSRDPDLRRINVRRLMILLRRRALQVGSRYVFEPNDDAFRRLMQRSFEATLGDLFARGAFTGRTAAEAFQVVTDVRLNNAQARDAGRFFVELKVAPSQPLTFLRIRLVQRGERLQASEER